MYRDYLDTPIGMLEICASEQGVTHVKFDATATDPVQVSAITQDCRQQLEEYFAGQRRHFDLPLAPKGTDFQQSIWHQLSQIPFGETSSYGDIARAVNNPKAVRAVGAANGRNPLPIVVPCHRVIGSNGTLTGFAGGLNVKAWLLNHEGVEL